MSEKQYKVYVIQGRSQRDYADCQTALARVPAQLETLPFIGDAAEVIERTHDADGLIVSSSPITREVMSALKNLKVVIRTGVGAALTETTAALRTAVDGASVTVQLPACALPGIVIVPPASVTAPANFGVGRVKPVGRKPLPVSCVRVEQTVMSLLLFCKHSAIDALIWPTDWMLSDQRERVT